MKTPSLEKLWYYNRMKTLKKTSIFIFICILFSSVSLAQPAFSRVNSTPGAFSRMGFGARGIGMGNALSAVNQGNLVGYYNPAVTPYQNENSFQTGYSFLSLDRSLNFLNFTRKFEFYAKNDTSAHRKPRSTAGVSIGIINAGVSEIDGRDNHGFKTEELSTSENQIFVSVANKFSDKFSIGITAKFYYYSLYEDISSTGFGFDVGLLYRINEQLNLAFVLTDINTKYKWDTNDIYGVDGSQTTNEFPLWKKIGLSYYLPKQKVLLAAEFALDNYDSKILRMGAEYNVIENLYIRGGLDNWNLDNADAQIRPSLGFSYSRELGPVFAGFDYAYVVERYAAFDRHIIGVNVIF